ncbi:MAG: dihydropteroate synthase [Sphingomonas sp. SCN 67-18]|uniref:dihydropteroate synthase n=1 Tax=uncultured Sphingomonas sp. TaxID=158754 RepID=UPI00086B3F86|nr:dihydropteroate synthase [Sphingomonas sp. SCN 67-18]ODU22736.1 MAG: dihydropteroate synthase [Sphingomonas sp. SCN 67-18]
MTLAALSDIGADAKVYLRPDQFVESPVGLDGQTARLGGGLLWHGAYELIVVTGGRRTARHMVPVAEIGAAIARLPDAQAQAAQAVIARLAAPRAPLALGGRTIRFDQPQVAAILNMTPDSFSDGGAHPDDPAKAADAGFAMAAAGAALIDVGGESTRPGAAAVWEGDEIARVVPVIERLSAAGVAISIDTRKAAVMEAALAAGAHIVNDVSALLYDDRALEVVARAACPVVLMHHGGTPADLHGGPRLADPLIAVHDWLAARIAAVEAAGIARDRIMVDPGIGFGKSLADNLALINGLALLQGLGCPLMLGVSRKRMIGALSNEAPVGDRLGGSLALALAGVGRGAQMLRVHDVAETVQAVRVWRGLRDQALVG